MKIKLIVHLFVMIVLINNSSKSNAQRTVHWIGGTPGRTADWFCSKNWSNDKIPDEFSIVTITDKSTSTLIYPVINNGEVKIWQLHIVSAATLTLKSFAKLEVLDCYNVPNLKSIKNQGQLKIPLSHHILAYDR
ncbi:MAG: hypothetical protein IPG55_15460 [Saprospiraceae bacterium]|nr:hypothetical protein [Candidatus Defluviibacterium haderslevense]MBK7242411.1 hypothetical protein [Candidatus Defluviibacterium haderslevense]